MIVPPEIIKKLIAIEKSTADNEKAIQEIRKKLEKPVVDWCIGMWVRDKSVKDKSCGKGIIINKEYSKNEYCICFFKSPRVLWYEEELLNECCEPIPYPYQEFLKVGDRVEANGKKGTITKIDGTVTPIKVLFDENIGSSSWYEIQQLTKIGEAQNE